MNETGIKPFYNLKYDRVFKTIVVDPNDTRLLNAILSDILDQKLEVIEFFKNDLGIRKKTERVKTVDVLVKTENDKKILVELNRNFDETTKIRNLSYFDSCFSQYNEKVRIMLIMNLS